MVITHACVYVWGSPYPRQCWFIFVHVPSVDGVWHDKINTIFFRNNSIARNTLHTHTLTPCYSIAGLLYLLVVHVPRTCNVRTFTVLSRARPSLYYALLRTHILMIIIIIYIHVIIVYTHAPRAVPCTSSEMWELAVRRAGGRGERHPHVHVLIVARTRRGVHVYTYSRACA